MCSIAHLRSTACLRPLFFASIISAVALSVLLPAGGAQAQSAAAAPTSAANAYADEPYVVEHASTVYTYQADGTGSVLRTDAIRIQSDDALRHYGVVTIPYASNSQQAEIVYVRVHHSDGTVVETPLADTLDLPAAVTRTAPFYSDLKEKQLPVRNLRIGDTLEWSSRITRTSAEDPGQFWGQETFPDNAVVLAQTLELQVPAGVAATVWSPTLKPVESDADGRHIYHWEFTQLAPTAGKQADADKAAKKKVVWTAAQELDAEQGKLPTVAWTTFKSWEAVGAWYRSLEEGRTVPTPEIKAKVAELIAGLAAGKAATDEDKVRAIYSYVATQIRYIGVAFGIGRFQPHAGAEVLSNQYGDCKDKHTLLATMLAAAGIQSDAVLIGAGIRFNQDVPSPMSFNHLITHVHMPVGKGKPDQPIWLDATAEIAPYRVLIAAIRDKQALVIPQTAEAPHVERTPAALPFPSFLTLNSTGSIGTDGISHSHFTLSARGDIELALRVAFHQASPAQYDQVVQALVHGIGFGGTTSNATVTPPDDTTVPFSISYDYERERAADWQYHRFIAETVPAGLPRINESDPMVRSLNLQTPRIDSSKSTMKIPDGWSAVLPKDIHTRSVYASFDQTYRLENGAVITERKLEVLKGRVPVADLATYKQWATDTNLGSDPYVVLLDVNTSNSVNMPKGTHGSIKELQDNAAPSVSLGNTKAADLVRAAYASIQQSDFDSAKTSLNQAEAISPQQPGIWATRALIDIHNKSNSDAIYDYQKELALHPTSVGIYPPLVNLLQGPAEHKQLVGTFRDWTAATPGNPFPIARLMMLLINDGDSRGALTAAQAARVHMSDAAQKDDAFLFALGRAQLETGDKTAGAATLATLLRSSTDPGSLNNAAYNLADAGLELPLAEASARTALGKLETESATWTLDDDAQTLKNNTYRILSTWDTLGWTLYKEGKLDEAKSYLQATWLHRPEIQAGQHLGDLLAAQGDKSAALATYQIALASIPLASAGGNKEQSELEKAVRARADALVKAGVKSSVASPENELQALSSVSLGPAANRRGMAEYRLLLKGGKVTGLRQLGSLGLPDAQTLLGHADLSRYFAAGSGATLIRTAYLTCQPDSCSLLFEP